MGQRPTKEDIEAQLADEAEKKKKKRSMKEELEAHRCGLDPEDFKEVLADTFAQMCPGMTVDNLLCDWRLHRDFCKRINVLAGIRPTGDVLLSTILLGMRKQGNYGLPLYERVT